MGASGRRPPLASASAPVPEELLCRIWAGQAIDRPVRAAGGEPIDLRAAGQWRRGAGPDFRGASLSIAGRAVEGAVEVHRRASDWHRHGHDRDRRYENVVLHVVLVDDLDEPVRTAAGQVVPTVVLADHLARSPAEAAARLPAVPTFCRPGDPCQVCPPDPERLGVLLDRLGAARLEAKARRFAAAIAQVGPDQALYAGLLDALGYRENRAPFQQLAERLPWQRLAVESDVESAAALLLGVGGLLPPRRPVRGLPLAALAERWAALGPDAPAALSPDGWELAVRPANSPLRRAFAAAVLVVERLRPSPSAAVRDWVGAARRRSELARAIRVGSEQWAVSGELSLPTAHCPLPTLLGMARANEMAANVLLPFALAEARRLGDVRLAVQARALWVGQGRLAENEVSRGMARQLLGEAGRGVVTGGARQQGLIQLCQEYCLARRCADCPVAACAAAGGVVRFTGTAGCSAAW